MNDETREELSAYLDGALPEAERAALEARLAASAELRGALEDLRAVSNAVKSLPKEPLPPGFMARFSARRARGDAPRQDWVFLPPAARPVVAALSCAVVALVIWNKAAVEPEETLIHPPHAANVYEAGNAPVSQLDLSKEARSAPGGGGLGGGAAGELKKTGDATALGIAGVGAGTASPVVSLDSLQNAAPAEDERKIAAKLGSVAAARGGRSGRALGQPLNAAADAAAAPEPALTDRTRLAMTEEERSARNEQMFGELEKQKKSLGMKVLPKSERRSGPSVAAMLGLPEPAPAAPMVHGASPTLLKPARADGPAAENTLAFPDGSAPGRVAPDAGLVLMDAGSLASSWVLLGLPGDPPATDFSTVRLVIIKPSATKILLVTPGRGAITVVYRALQAGEASDPLRDRVAPLPLSPKAVLIYDASPR
jgi:anti-sigma factor RsiW